MQIETSVRYHFLPTRLAKSEKMGTNQVWFRIWNNFGKNLYCHLLELKIAMMNDPAVPFFGMCPKITLAHVRDTGISMFIASLLVITEVGKLPKCPLQQNS